MSRDEMSVKQAVPPRLLVYEIEGYRITSSDETLDSPGTAPDRIEDGEHCALEGLERQRFIVQIGGRLGVQAVQGLSLRRLEGFFRASTRAEDYLRSRGYDIGLLQASIAAGHADDGGFLNETTRRTLRSLVERSIQPGITSAEALSGHEPQAQEIWRLLTQEPFQSLRRGRSTLQRLVSEGLLDPLTLHRVEELFQTLLQRGVERAPDYGREILRTGRTPEDFRRGWMVLAGLRNAALRRGISFDAREIDRMIEDLERHLPADPGQREVLRALTE